MSEHEHPNAQIARKAYEAFSAGDTTATMDLLDPDTAWHIAGDSSISGSYHGPDGVLELFAKLSEGSNGTFTLDLHDVVANDEHTVGLVHARAERDGKVLDARIVHVMHVRDGKIEDLWAFTDDQRDVDAFWT